MTGNLANFTDLIRKDGYTAERLIDGPITYDLLKNYKILIISWSSEAFSNSEIDAIVNFVGNGGGLLPKFNKSKNDFTLLRFIFNINALNIL